MTREEEDRARKQMNVEVSKKHFVEALRGIPSGPARVRDSRLRKLAVQYRDDLKECNDEIPYSLQRLGMQDRMTFDDFIWEVVG